MIRCPTCGTFNHDSQRTCRSCDSTLPQTRRRCSECGALNPVGNLFCDRCNARLVDAEDIVPTPASDSANDNHTTVKGISLPTRAAITEDDARQRTAAVSPALPDWLAGLVDEQTEFGFTAPALSEPDEAGLGHALDEDASLPHWLSGGEALSSAPSLDAAGAAPVPTAAVRTAWLTEGAEEVTALEAAGEGRPNGWPAVQGEPLPDWLSDVFGATTTGEAEARGAQGVVASFDEDTEVERLRDESSPEESGAAIFAESELPDWFAQAQAPITGGLGGASGPTAKTLGEATESVAEPGDSYALKGTGDVPEDDGLALPDWLREIASEDADSEQLPDWLAALSREQAPSPAISVDGVFVAIEEGSVSEPAVASEAARTRGTDWRDAPDVMSTRAPSALKGKGSAIFEEDISSPDRAELPAAVLPGWLSDLAPVEVAVAPKARTPVFVGQLSAEERASGARTLPERPDQVPEWLRDMDLEPSEAISPAEPAPEPVDLTRAEVPSWLQELAPPGTHEGGVHEAAAAADLLAPAEIPEWVEALRSEVRAEGAPPPIRAIPPTPAEPEGPLEGLIGVLPAVSAVDRPADAKPAAVGRIPEAITAQAQLWQRLLEQPRSAERAVWRGRPSDRQGSSRFRWVVSLLLVVGLFAAFWLIPDDVRLAQVSPTQIGGGGLALVEGIDRLEPGDTVILAIEYSPAYADEMSRIAAPILAHLKSRQVEVSVVSSLPEGVGLGYALPSLPDVVGMTGDGYLAGSASGIAAFLAREEAASADRLVVLVSEPQHLIWWLEQNALLGADALPISVATSASAGPLVSPYLENTRVEGWVTGLPQALAYGEIRGDGSGGDLVRVLDLLMLAHWVVVALLLVAFFYTLVDAGTHHRRKGAS